MQWAPINARTLRGLNWRGDERLYSYEDLFKGQQIPEQIKIKGLPLPKIEDSFFSNENLENLNDNSTLKAEDLKNRPENQVENFTDKETLWKVIFSNIKLPQRRSLQD